MTAVKSYIFALCLCLSSTLNAVVICCDSDVSQSTVSLDGKPPCHDDVSEGLKAVVDGDKSNSCCDCNGCVQLPSYIENTSEQLTFNKVFFLSHNEASASPTANSPDDPPIIIS